MGRTILRIAALAALLAAQAASAQTPTPPAAKPEPELSGDVAMQAFAQSDAYKTIIARALASVPPSIAPKCPKQVSGESNVAILQAVRFDADGFPQAGSWRHSFPVRGCGNDTTLNFWMFPAGNKRVAALTGVPGTTRTDLLQQQNARNFILVALDRPSRGCAGFVTINTRFGGWGAIPPGPSDPGEKANFRPWWETWTMLGCDKRYDVPISFAPNVQGTQIIPGDVTTR